MAMIIRLRRGGRRNDAAYRVVVADWRRPIKGGYKESLGHYIPKSKTFVINKERYTYWIGKGVKPSKTVKELVEKYASASE